MRIEFLVFPFQVELPLAEVCGGGTSGLAPEANKGPLSVFGDGKQMMARYAHRKIAPI